MQISIFPTDDGTGPDKIAHISGPPDCCDHASQIINDLLQSIRVRDEGQGVNVIKYIPNQLCIIVNVWQQDVIILKHAC